MHQVVTEEIALRLGGVRGGKIQRTVLENYLAVVQEGLVVLDNCVKSLLEGRC